jgi:hypothetical protein
MFGNRIKEPYRRNSKGLPQCIKIMGLNFGKCVVVKISPVLEGGEIKCNIFT